MCVLDCSRVSCPSHEVNWLSQVRSSAPLLQAPTRAFLSLRDLSQISTSIDFNAIDANRALDQGIDDSMGSCALV